MCKTTTQAASKGTMTVSWIMDNAAQAKHAIMVYGVARMASAVEIRSHFVGLGVKDCHVVFSSGETCNVAIQHNGHTLHGSVVQNRWLFVGNNDQTTSTRKLEDATRWLFTSK